MPSIYRMFFNHKEGFYLFPLPWLAYGIHLIWKGTARPPELIAFSSSLIMALLTLTILFGLALALPWIPSQVLVISNLRGEYLTDEQRAFAFQAADRKDADAHMILFRHYAFMGQTDLAEYYLNRAAELGSSVARHVLEQREREYGIPRQSATPVPTAPARGR